MSQSHRYLVVPKGSLLLEPDDVVVIIGAAARGRRHRGSTVLIELARFTGRQLLDVIGDAAVKAFGFTSSTAAVTSKSKPLVTTARVDVWRRGEHVRAAPSFLHVSSSDDAEVAHV